MRRVKGDPADRVAEGVEAVASPGRHRLDIDAFLLDLLPGEDARRQVELLLRQRHRAAVVVDGLVQDVVTDGGAFHGQSAMVWRLTSETCVK